MTDPNLNLLALIHNLKSSSADAQKALELAIANTADGSARISISAANALRTLLALQNQIITGLVEQNATIVDHVEALIARAEKK